MEGGGYKRSHKGQAMLFLLTIINMVTKRGKRRKKMNPATMRGLGD